MFSFCFKRGKEITNPNSKRTTHIYVTRYQNQLKILNVYTCVICDINFPTKTHVLILKKKKTSVENRTQKGIRIVLYSYNFHKYEF